jgi:hypothetical protein
MPRYDERHWKVPDVDRRNGRHECGGHDGLAMRQHLSQQTGVGAQGSCMESRKREAVRGRLYAVCKKWGHGTDGERIVVDGWKK